MVGEGPDHVIPGQAMTTVAALVGVSTGEAARINLRAPMVRRDGSGPAGGPRRSCAGTVQGILRVQRSHCHGAQ